ncbi:Pro-cathepsin H [Sarcoptes scabiei]|nr:Pro-cathepsin H [Sarcoptes scabiei]
MKSFNCLRSLSSIISLSFLILIVSLAYTTTDAQQTNSTGKSATKKLSPIQTQILESLEKSKTEISKFLTKIGLKAEDNFNKLFPNLSRIDLKQIKNCYQMRIDDEEYNMLEKPFTTTIKIYYQHFSDNFELRNLPAKLLSLHKSMMQIAKHSMDCVINTANYQLGFTPYSDWSDEEFKVLLGERFDESSLNGYSQRRSEDESDGNRQYSNLPSNQTNQANLLSPPSSFSDGRVERQPQQSSNINRRTKRNVGVDEVCKAKNRSPLPKKLDWRAQGKVTSIKNQGSCGSCWTFTSLAALESAYLIKKNQKLDLSEQELLSCARKNGCKGGTAIDAYNYFLKRKGVTDEQTWPYAKKETVCLPKPFMKKYAPIKDYCLRGQYVHVNGKPEVLTDEEIMYIVREFGPVYTTINVDDLPMKNFKGGIYHSKICTKKTNHAVTIVGWDEQSWLIKNSWGEKWGEDGFFRMKKGENLCGINTYIMFPII